MCSARLSWLPSGLAAVGGGVFGTRQPRTSRSDLRGRRGRAAYCQELAPPCARVATRVTARSLGVRDLAPTDRCGQQWQAPRGPWRLAPFPAPPRGRARPATRATRRMSGSRCASRARSSNSRMSARRRDDRDIDLSRESWRSRRRVARCAWREGVGTGPWRSTCRSSSAENTIPPDSSGGCRSPRGSNAHMRWNDFRLRPDVSGSSRGGRLARASETQLRCRSRSQKGAPPEPVKRKFTDCAIFGPDERERDELE